jgi:protein-S-isoprenylcysteine O-methyltransferase Ste14
MTTAEARRLRYRRLWAKRATPPWEALAAVIGAFGLLLWLPSWSFSGLLAPVGLLCAVRGRRSVRRRWLLWLAVALNVLLLAVTVWWWLDQAFA